MRAASYRPAPPPQTDRMQTRHSSPTSPVGELCLLASVETEGAVCRQPATLGCALTALAGAAGAAEGFAAATGHGGPPDAVEWLRATEQPEATEPLSAIASPDATEPLVARALPD